MALRWFIGAITTQIVGQSGDECSKTEAKEVKKVCFNARKENSNDSGGSSGCGYELGFQMPLHYPRYKKGDYEKMEEWRVDMLLREYGLSCSGSVEEKRAFAMGAFLWPDQL